MPQPTTATLYPDAWHAAEAAQETAWLDDWARGRVCPATVTVSTVHEPANALPAITTAGSHR
ncbi:hypothetical protein [Streptomyces misionensis]|uniref:hypothetical protein n=1 Tax=Streptomyces misionensis TaxID=67331 RepID=UPI00396C1BFD